MNTSVVKGIVTKTASDSCVRKHVSIGMRGMGVRVGLDGGTGDGMGAASSTAPPPSGGGAVGGGGARVAITRRAAAQKKLLTRASTRSARLTLSGGKGDRVWAPCHLQSLSSCSRVLLQRRVARCLPTLRNAARAYIKTRASVSTNDMPAQSSQIGPSPSSTSRGAGPAAAAAASAASVPASKWLRDRSRRARVALARSASASAAPPSS